MIDNMRDLAAVNPSDFGGIMNFYRQKIKILEEQRIQLIGELESSKGVQKERHEQEWENFRLRGEVKELKISLSETRLSYFEERTASVKLTNEIENLKEELRKEKTKVDQFLKFFKPGDQKLILKEKEKPRTELKFLQKAEDSCFSTYNKPRTFDSTKRTGVEKTGLVLMKSVHLAKDELMRGVHKDIDQRHQEFGDIGSVNLTVKKIETENAVMTEELKSMQVEIQKQKEIFEKHVATIEGDKEKLLTRVNELERVNFELNRQYFEQRVLFSDTENRLQEELEIQRVKTGQLSERLSDESRNNQQSREYINKLIEERVLESSESLKRQLRSKETCLESIKEQYVEVQRLFKERLQRMTEQTLLNEKKCKQLEEGRRLDDENRFHEIESLRAKLDQLKKITGAECQRGIENSKVSAKSKKLTDKISSKILIK